MELAGRVAIVTGAGQGIGRAIALELARLGADVGVADLNSAAVESVAEEVRVLGRRGIARTVDVSKKQQVEELVGGINDELGGLDIMVNNAGIISVERFLDLTEEHWDRAFAVNTKGALFGVQAAGRLMVDAGTKGRIVNMSSVAGKNGRPLLAAYSASKAAIINLTQSAAQALAPHQITVNCICPGVVDAPMGESALSQMNKLAADGKVAQAQSDVPPAPLGPTASPEDVARMVAYLAGTGGEYITAQSINVDGGRCVL